ncbi:hypothetical protein QE250_12185 [Chromatiaceae bacterium AAb-1]|nr:hypothetical protein [Chromatiaceae bacterium AAb-1]
MNKDMNKEQQKQLMAPTGQMNADNDVIAAAVQQQASQLRADSDKMLKQLLSEQKARLQEMVQQLQNQNNNTGAEVAQTASGQESEVINDVNKAPESKVPLEDVTRLQQHNMAHLDTLLERINATMQNSLDIPGTD